MPTNSLSSHLKLISLSIKVNVPGNVLDVVHEEAYVLLCGVHKRPQVTGLRNSLIIQTP